MCGVGFSISWRLVSPLLFREYAEGGLQHTMLQCELCLEIGIMFCGSRDSRSRVLDRYDGMKLVK